MTTTPRYDVLARLRAGALGDFMPVDDEGPVTFLAQREATPAGFARFVVYRCTDRTTTVAQTHLDSLDHAELVALDLAHAERNGQQGFLL